MQRLIQWLSGMTDPRILGLFRIIFGVFMFFEMVIYFQIGLVRNMFVLPAINFQYDFFRWLTPLPETWMNIILGIMLACTIAIILGIFFKWACRFFALGYLYFLLLDKSIFNNHMYLFILLAFLLSFTDADRTLSLRRKSAKAEVVPRWQVFILQLQFMIVYFYGGIAKLNLDWLLRCQPVKFLVEQLSADHWMAGLIKSPLGVYFLNYGGLIIDLGAPLLLWNKKWRKYAIFGYILFHLINGAIFPDIGIFPYVMLFSLILFYESHEVPFLRKRTNQKATGKIVQAQPISTQSSLITSHPVRYILIAYFIFQFLFPFRGFFLPNDMDWTTIGNRFSWRMKINSKEIQDMEFVIVDTEKQQNYPVDIRPLVNEMQILNMAMDPRSVVDFAKMLKDKAETNGVRFPQVFANIKVKYNGKPTQAFVDPGVNLAAQEAVFYKKLNWVMPLQN